MTAKNLHIVNGAVRDQAVSWHLRLSEGPTEQDWLEFMTWLESSPAHRVSYEEVEQLSSRIESQKKSILNLIQPITRTDPASRTLRLAHLVRDMWKSATRASWVAGGIAVAMAVLIIFMVTAPETIRTVRYSTAVGEQRDIMLEDGSRVKLNTRSVLSVAFKKKSRMATLESGEAAFDISSDPQRPFIVLVADQTVEVVGTEFNILRHAGYVTITVARGIVQVQTGGAPSGVPPKRLVAGDQITHREGTTITEATKVDPALALEWREGRIIFKDATLLEVITSLNRYFTRPIRIQDPALGALKFSGVIKMEEETVILRHLEEFFPIVAREESDKVVIEPKRIDR